ncbi:MAG: hypothetical protein R3F17_01470 [Planctomycetota bacterium]
MKVQKTLRLALGAGLFTSLLQLAPAQVTASYTLLLSEGDAMPGFPGELITRIDDVDVNGNGDWLAEVATDGATAQNTYVVHNGNTIWVESGNLGFTAPVGGIAGGFMDTMQINDNGDILLVFPLTHPVNGSITVMTVNGVTVIDAKTTVCGAANVPAGTIYDSISEAWMNNNNQLLVACRLLVPGATSSVDALVRMDINGTGGIVSETKIAMVGETLPGPNHVTPIQGFSFSKARQAINDNGDFIWYVDDDHTVAPGSTLTDSNMYINNTLLYNEADPFPLDPVNAFEHFSTCEVDLNDAGDFVFSGFDSGDNAEDSWIFKSIGGTPTMIAHESEACPAAMGPYLTAGFGFGGLVPMSDSGDVLWYIDTDSTDTTTDQGVFYNDTWCAAKTPPCSAARRSLRYRTVTPRSP